MGGAPPPAAGAGGAAVRTGDVHSDIMQASTARQTQQRCRCARSTSGKSGTGLTGASVACVCESAWPQVVSNPRVPKPANGFTAQDVEQLLRAQGMHYTAAQASTRVCTSAA